MQKEEKTPLTPETLRKLQLVEMKALDEVKRICEMHEFDLKLVQKPEIFRYHLDDAYRKVFVVAM